MRMRKKKNLAPRMEACGMYLIKDPFAIRGRWRELMPAARELREELGIETAGEDLRFAGRIRRRNSFTDIWVLRRDVELSSLRLQTEEVAQAKWVTRTELMDMVARRTFHHYGRPYFELVLQALYPGEG